MSHEGWGRGRRTTEKVSQAKLISAPPIFIKLAHVSMFIVYWGSRAYVTEARSASGALNNLAVDDSAARAASPLFAAYELLASVPLILVWVRIWLIHSWPARR